jgi:hypothetical protein
MRQWKLWLIKKFLGLSSAEKNCQESGDGLKIGPCLSGGKELKCTGTLACVAVVSPN